MLRVTPSLFEHDIWILLLRIILTEERKLERSLTSTCPDSFILGRRQSVSKSHSIFLPFLLSFFLPFYLIISISFYLSFGLSVFLSFSFFYLSIFLSINLSTFLSYCTSFVVPSFLSSFLLPLFPSFLLSSFPSLFLSFLLVFASFFSSSSPSKKRCFVVEIFFSSLLFNTIH